MNALRCLGLSKTFGGVDALTNINFTFPSEGTVAIIGPNGAGKTTLINVITGFLRPDSGHVFLGQTELTQLAPYKIVRLGIARTFQDVRIISQMSVRSNTLLGMPQQRGENFLHAIFGGRANSEAARNNKLAMRLLKAVGLEDHVDETAGELSYGQQKLLTVACCLATEARILIFDEPVAGVHPKLVTDILKLLQRLKESGKLIIFIEHDIAAVREVADIVVVMDDATVVAQGRPSEVLERPEILEAYLA